MIIMGDVPVSDEGFSACPVKKDLPITSGCVSSFMPAAVGVCPASSVGQRCERNAQIHSQPVTKKITAEELRHLLNQQTGRYITQLSSQKVSAITSSFGKAAVLAKQAGFDMIQIHGDRMCSSFSSGIYNERTDSYGGSPEKRAHFAVWKRYPPYGRRCRI